MQTYLSFLLVLFLWLNNTLSIAHSFMLKDKHHDETFSSPKRMGEENIVDNNDTQIVSLQVEYETTPIGMDVEKPRFSWQMMSSRRGASQTAYRIIVSNEKGKQVWDSQKTTNKHSLHIEYAGEPLEPTTRYTWKVYVWNESGQIISASSWFETGFLNSSLSAWDGAEWIGGDNEDLVLYPNYLPTYNIRYTVQLDKSNGTTKAGFVYGANDPRLMDKNQNIYNLQNGKDESYIEAEFDISGLAQNGKAMINIYRVGYAPTDNSEKPLQQLEIPLSIIHSDNKYSPHTIHLKTMYSVTQVYIDGEEDANKVGQVTVNPIGGSWDFICFPLLCDIGFSMKPQQKAHFSNLEIRNYRTPNNILFSEKLSNKKPESLFSGKKSIKVTSKGYLTNGGNTGEITTIDITKKSMPMLRSEFKTEKKNIVKARLYVTAKGIYEVYINGKRIGDDYFNPGLTQYNKHHLYQTYDITETLNRGDNAIGVMLAEGWWSGAITYMGYLWNLFGDRQSLLSKLVITYEDGSRQVIVSNPDTWLYHDNGPVVYGSFFQGEVYDARKEAATKGWSEPGYNAQGWKNVSVLDNESKIINDPDIETGQMPSVNDFTQLKLIGQFGSTVKKVDEISAISIEEVRPGVFLYDMGQNMVGIPRISLEDMAPGKEIRLRFAEVKYPDLPEFKDNVGMIMLENIRGAMAQDIYITKGGGEEIHPRFTFHGYRYIEVTGIDRPLPLTSVRGEILSSLHKITSSYETANAKVNKLWENITWSARGNFLSIPTDCPQRNERMGWSGDISVFSRTATYLGDMAQFLDRHMMAMRDTQREDGRFADVAPIGGGFGGILWGSAGITVAWENYRQYANKRLLENHYASMKKYIDYLTEFIDPETGILTEGNLGDWLGPEQEENDNSLLWEAYFIYDLDLMRQIADILENEEDAEYFSQLYQKRKSFFNKTYINPATGETLHSGFRQPEKKGLLVGTQTSYVLPLAFGICDDNNKTLIIDRLMEHITRPNHSQNGDIYPPYALMTGFIGTAWVSQVLSDQGYSEAAYRILQQEAYPSWLYSVNEGATTIWERLNSYTREHGFSGNNSMNSFNHYSFGAVGSWMINRSLGIERDKQQPGFQHFILRPEPDPSEEMKWAKGFYDSPYGRIESSWRIESDGSLYHFVIPANSYATLYLPAKKVEMIRESGKPIVSSTLMNNIEIKNNIVEIKLQSGEYHFKVLTE